jgi:hypothetical protein
MLFPHSYYSKKIEKEINDLVGKPIGYLDRIKMRGIGSQRFLVEEANSEVMELISKQNTPPYTNIELRPKGIILWFRVKLDSWVLVLPYFKLSVFKTAGHLIIHQDHWKLKLEPAHNATLKLKFIQKLLGLKAEIVSSESPVRE